MRNYDFKHSWTIGKAKQVLPPHNDRNLVSLAFGISALIHCLFILITYLNFSSLFLRQSSENLIPKLAIDVELLKQLQTPKKQIVSDSQKINQIKPENSNLEAKENNSILDESIKRGDGGEKFVAPKKEIAKQETKKSETPKEKTFKKQPALEKLDLKSPEPKTNPENLDQKSLTQQNLEKALAGNLLAGTGGSPDFLPNVKDGEITLLNTKASKYAVFVRRVALQVFNELKAKAWRELSYQEIKTILGSATVVAKLNPSGNLISANLVSDSGSKTFNDLIYFAVKNRAQDPHPPESALVNGEFHFIFQTKMTSTLTTNPRTGGFGERRWLVLSVGLE